MYAIRSYYEILDNPFGNPRCPENDYPAYGVVQAVYLASYNFV